MAKRILLLALSISWLPCGGALAEPDAPEVAGQWYGTFDAGFPVGRWASLDAPTGGIFEILVEPDGSGHYSAVLYIADLGWHDVSFPMEVVGNQVAIGDPQFAFGAISGEVMSGIAFVPHPLNPSDFLLIEWQAHKQVATLPGLPSDRPCDELPPLFCTGSAEYCSELVPFVPAVGAGYLNYPVKDETWDDQHRSFLRRDLMRAVQYAAAKVACRTTDWNYGNFAPLGLGDMSDANGEGPTTNGLPDHLGHEDGNHIDIAYYQLFASDNLLRPVGRHEDGYLTARPYALDSWRTALFLVYLCEHPHIRYIAVDDQVGLLLEETFVDLEALGWIDEEARARIPLVYGADVVTAGHHDHMHVAMKVLHPIVANARLNPNTLNKSSSDKYVTGYIELVNGYGAAEIDVSSLALIVNGHTLVYAERHGSGDVAVSESGKTSLTVKFDGDAVRQSVEVGSAEMAFIGTVSGLSFQASDTIRVLSR